MENFGGPHAGQYFGHTWTKAWGKIPTSKLVVSKYWITEEVMANSVWSPRSVSCPRMWPERQAMKRWRRRQLTSSSRQSWTKRQTPQDCAPALLSDITAESTAPSISPDSIATMAVIPSEPATIHGPSLEHSKHGKSIWIKGINGINQLQYLTENHQFIKGSLYDYDTVH